MEARGLQRQLVDHDAATVAAIPSSSATDAVKASSVVAWLGSRTLRAASPGLGGSEPVLDYLLGGEEQ